MKKIIVSMLFCFFYSISATKNHHIDHVTIAILAKDKAHTLPLYLECIEQQTWPASKTYLYIRTNNNNDTTQSILESWITKVQHKYAGIYFDGSNVDVPVEKYKQHEWNCERFKVLGKIRQDSVSWARAHHSHYFVADCDNFIKPHTIDALMNTNLPIVAPLLHTQNSCYSNFHAAIDKNGYFADSYLNFDLLEGKIKGLIEVPVVHCTYFVRFDVLDKLSYDDQSYRYEYVIFSDSARKNSIPQYLDTREIYGGISFAEKEFTPEEYAWLTVYALDRDIN